MNHHDIVVKEPAKMLRNIQRWLDKAVEFATEKKFEPNVLLAARLAPDQFPLTRQIQSACDSAKGNASRLAGREPPSHPDTETTIEQLKARIETTIQYLETLQPADFDGADERKISLAWMQGRHALGADYLRDFGIPNFHFHVTHAYAILRHNGVPLGKIDFIGPITLV